MSGGVPVVTPVLRNLRRRLRPHPAEEAVPARVTVLAAVLIAVGAVGALEEFTRQAAFAALVICVGFWVSHHRRHARNGWLKVTLAALILVVAWDFFVSLLANPFDPRIPLVRLFLWLQVLHSFDLPARKDLKYSLASAVVLMAVAAVFARDLTFGVLLVPFALASATAMVAMAAGDVLALPPARSGLARAGIDGAGLWWRQHLFGVGVRLGMTVLLTGALLFTVIPRSQGFRVRWLPVSPQWLLTTRLYPRIVNPAYPGIDISDPTQPPPVFNPLGYVGFSTHVDLRLRGVLSDTLVMRVRTTRPGLWRGLAFDIYTGRGWVMSDPTVEEYTSSQPRIVPRFGSDEPWPADSVQVIQTFYVEAAQPNVIFAAYRPFEVFFPTGTLAVDRYASLRSPVQLEPGMIYSVISRVPAPTSALLQRRGEIPDAIRRRYLQVPPLSPRVRQLADRLTGGLSSPYDKALAINRFLWEHYRYNLQAPLLPDGADAVDHFLFVSTEGSCEIFSSAMATLLRAAGVPARLITGYTTGSYNVFTGYYEVHNSDAHAWVEVYAPGVGWIEFEPTPGFPSPDDLAARPATDWLARDAMIWAWTRARSAIGPIVRAVTSQPAGRIPPSSGALAALLLTWALVRRRRQSNGNPESVDAVLRLYEEMLQVLSRLGFLRAAAMTPREFLATLPSMLRADASHLTIAFELRRYGRGAPSLAGEQLARGALASLREGAQRWRREHARSHRLASVGG